MEKIKATIEIEMPRDGTEALTLTTIEIDGPVEIGTRFTITIQQEAQA